MASVLADPRQKRGYMVSGNNQGQKGTFWPHPNMPQFQIRGKMRKITGAKSPYYTGDNTEINFDNNISPKQRSQI